MNRFCRYQIVFAFTTLLLMMPMGKSYAEVGVADLTGEDKVKFERFRELFQHGHPDEFFAYVADYEQDLKKKGFMMLYYKLQNNKGFFALRHNSHFCFGIEDQQSPMYSFTMQRYYFPMKLKNSGFLFS